MASPRISFSQNIPTTEHQRADGSLPVEPRPSDFNFSIAHQISADLSSNADELFSDGKILPFFKNPVRAEPKPPGPIPRRKPADSSPGSGYESGRRSFWRFGRSSSVGSAAAERGPIFASPLNRCKSTGSFPAAAVGNSRFRSDSGRRKTYYFSGSRRGGANEGGVRINPILNVPAPIYIAGGGGGGGGGGGSSGAIGGIFAYLLCNCGGEAKRDEMQDFLAGGGRDGTGMV